MNSQDVQHNTNQEEGKNKYLWQHKNYYHEAGFLCVDLSCNKLRNVYASSDTGTRFVWQKKNI